MWSPLHFSISPACRLEEFGFRVSIGLRCESWDRNICWRLACLKAPPCLSFLLALRNLDFGCCFSLRLLCEEVGCDFGCKLCDEPSSTKGLTFFCPFDRGLLAGCAEFFCPFDRGLLATSCCAALPSLVLWCFTNGCRDWATAVRGGGESPSSQ